MRRLLYYSLLCLLWISVDSCKDDEVAAPPKPSFSVDKTSGSIGNEFTFTVDQVDGTISLLPYGMENPSMGGVSIPASSFTNGKAVVKFSYGSPGVFKAVVVSNNHSTDGNSIKNTYSDPKDITITASGTEISDFNLGILRTDGYAQDIFTSLTTKTTIDKTNKTIDVVVRYSLPKDSKNPDYFTDKTKLVAKFASSGFSSVSVNGAAQVSGSSVNNFSGPVDYVVKAQDGTTATYKVNAIFTPVETETGLKSFSGVSTSKANEKNVLRSYVDETTKSAVMYGVSALPSSYDSVKVKFETKGEFATVKYNGKKLAQDTQLDLSAKETITVVAQDSTTIGTYSVYAVAAPTLMLEFASLNPVISGSNDANFNINLSPLAATFPDPTEKTIATTGTYFYQKPGVSVLSTVITELSTVNEENPNGISRPFISGDVIDFTKNVKFEATVLDTNIGVTYKVVYTASVTTK